MTFDEILGQAIEMLQRRGRVSYGALKRQFALDDEYLADLKVELIEVLEVAADQDGKMLVWQGAAADQEPETERNGEAERRHISSPADSQTERRTDSRRAEAERRQLTVMFCDLVGSTALSTQLDPEDYHTVVQHYHQSCEAVIQRYGGFVPQHLGDGLLVYFGWWCHRIVAGLLEAIEKSRIDNPLSTYLKHDQGAGQGQNLPRIWGC